MQGEAQAGGGIYDPTEGIATSVESHSSNEHSGGSGGDLIGECGGPSWSGGGRSAHAIGGGWAGGPCRRCAPCTPLGGESLRVAWGQGRA
jgi:hypothetical protein